MKLSDQFRGFWTALKKKFGTPNGLATLDANGRIPSSLLPSSAMTIVGYLDAANEHTLPAASGYDPGSEILVTSTGFYNQSTEFTLPAGSTLTTLEAEEANALVSYGYVFTLTADGSELGTVKTFATNKVVFNNDTEIALPYEKDLHATSTPASVQVPVSKGDVLINIDKHWIHLDNTSSVTSVNEQTGAVVLTGNNVLIDDTSTSSIKSYIDSKDVKISEDENNALVKGTDDGLYVPTSSGVSDYDDLENKPLTYVGSAGETISISMEYDNGGFYVNKSRAVGVLPLTEAQLKSKLLTEKNIDVDKFKKFTFNGISKEINEVNVTFEQSEGESAAYSYRYINEDRHEVTILNIGYMIEDEELEDGVLNYVEVASDYGELTIEVDSTGVTVNPNYKDFFDDLKKVDISSTTGNAIDEKTDGLYVSDSYNDLTDKPLTYTEGGLPLVKSYITSIDPDEEILYYKDDSKTVNISNITNEDKLSALFLSDRGFDISALESITIVGETTTTYQVSSLAKVFNGGDGYFSILSYGNDATNLVIQIGYSCFDSSNPGMANFIVYKNILEGESTADTTITFTFSNNPATVTVNPNYKNFFDGLKETDISAETGNIITKKTDGLYTPTPDYNDTENIPVLKNKDYSTTKGTLQVDEILLDCYVGNFGSNGDAPATKEELLAIISEKLGVDVTENTIVKAKCFKDGSLMYSFSIDIASFTKSAVYGSEYALEFIDVNTTTYINHTLVIDQSNFKLLRKTSGSVSNIYDYVIFDVLNDGAVEKEYIINNNYNKFFDGLKETDVSAETGNIITKKDDGLYAEDSGKVKVSEVTSGIYYPTLVSNSSDLQSPKINSKITFDSDGGIKTAATYYNSNLYTEITWLNIVLCSTDKDTGAQTHRTTISPQIVHTEQVTASKRLTIPVEAPTSLSDGLIWLEE